MVRTEQITCDGCGADLTVRTNSVDYRLVLEAESKPGYGGDIYTDMMIYPPVDRTHHFCGMECLDLWRDRERFYSKLVGDRRDAWKHEHGTRLGQMWSYPSPPEDVSQMWRNEARENALASYPIKRRGGGL